MESPTDIEDWEILNESDLSPNRKPLDPIDSEDGAIKPDYFSLNPTKPQRKSEDEIGEGVVDSDNPSWLDPDSDSRYQAISNFRSCWSDESSEEPRSVVEENEEEVGGSELGEGGSFDGNEERVWWRMPLEVLKLWVLRARPVWSISIMAAIVGVVMLGRRLYKMKQKRRSIPLKIAIDDKRASQFVGRAARLNEAFSIVKRVPAIRPSLPAGSVTSWSMASLR